MQGAIDSTEMNEIMAVEGGSHLVEDIVRDGVEVLGHVCHGRKTHLRINAVLGVDHEEIIKKRQRW